ncbi:MAG: isochorismatase family protein, partial [Ardenticatenales bacterium]|nr:isochorismatase family protein [Ardenticatenales bacterium]
MRVPPTALLIIDAQQGLLDGEAAVPDAAGVIQRIGTVLAAARAAGALVVHLQHDGAAGTPDEPGRPGWFI